MTEKENKYASDKNKGYKYATQEVFCFEPDNVIGRVLIGGSSYYSPAVVAYIRTQRKGIFRSYVLVQNENYDKECEVGQTFTRKGAFQEIKTRIRNLTEIAAKELEIPIVNREEAKTLDEIANKEALKRFDEGKRY